MIIQFASISAVGSPMAHGKYKGSELLDGPLLKISHLKLSDELREEIDTKLS